MSELETQIAKRRETRRRLRQQGVEPYPSRCDYDLEPYDVHARFGERAGEELAGLSEPLRVPGRLAALRRQGESWIGDLRDGRARLRLTLSRDELDAPSRQLIEDLDPGDHVVARGRLGRTRDGELALEATSLELLGKALRPPSHAWAGGGAGDERHRQRDLDPLAQPAARRVLEARAGLLAALRAHLGRHGFLEVETPILRPSTGAGQEDLDIDRHLRAAPVPCLERLLVVGMHRVYGIDRAARGAARPAPELTTLDLRWAYADAAKLMTFSEEMLRETASQLIGEPALERGGERIELGMEWPRYTMRQSLSEVGGIDPARLEHTADLAAVFADLDLAWPDAVDQPEHPVLAAGSAAAYERDHPGVDHPADWYGHLLTALFEARVKDLLQEPTFIRECPLASSPLARPAPGDGRFADSGELYLGGMTIGSVFSELNDPDARGERFGHQRPGRRPDPDDLRALEHGMPPAAGLALSIDRLTMLLTDSTSVRDVILFPLPRPQAAEGE